MTIYVDGVSLLCRRAEQRWLASLCPPVRSWKFCLRHYNKYVKLSILGFRMINCSVTVSVVKDGGDMSVNLELEL